MTNADPYNLQRFVDAQDPIYDRVTAELRGGQKRSHWMWFVFPQIEGLGSSPTARRFAISSRDEAAAYLAHPVLGPRLRECSRIVTGVEGRSAEDIFGMPDCLKFHSSMTLFCLTTSDNAVFKQAIDRYFDGKLDEHTVSKLSG